MVVLLLLVLVQRQQHHQHANGSTIVKIFSCSHMWTYLTYLE
jgi:hypothetical protein